MSVWVEIWQRRLLVLRQIGHAPRERVSWNFLLHGGETIRNCHAPRERVSWNIWDSYNTLRCYSHAPRERVSWNRWLSSILSQKTSHAPRERVSWNALIFLHKFIECVTLHVSVWVEIWLVGKFGSVGKSRSTWACELKWFCASIQKYVIGHAPRERVSWNFFSDRGCRGSPRHAPRERVSWNKEKKAD